MRDWDPDSSEYQDMADHLHEAADMLMEKDKEAGWFLRGVCETLVGPGVECSNPPTEFEFAYHAGEASVDKWMTSAEKRRR